MDTRPLRRIFAHANRVAAAAAYVSISHGVRSSRALDTLTYHMVRDGTVRSDITQTAIRRGCAAARNIHEPEQSPEFKNPVIIMKAGKWSLNPVAAGYAAHASVGSRERPWHVWFAVPKKVGKMLEQYDVGELWITPHTYTITYSKRAPAVRKLEPRRSPASMIEALTSIQYLQDTPEPLTAVDVNAWGAMAGDSGGTTAMFNLKKCVDAAVAARQSETGADEWTFMMDGIRYKKRHGRRTTNDSVKTKRERQCVEHGGDKLYKKLGHQLRNLKRRRKNELANITRRQSAETRKLAKTFVGTKSDLDTRRRAIKSYHDMERLAVREKYARIERELGARRARCVVTAHPKKKRIDNQTRNRRISKSSRALDHAMHAAACCIVAHALATGSAIILEDLAGMTRGWTKFNKSTRTRLHAAGMMKFQRYIYERARWEGVEVLWIYPRNTSALCCICRTHLTGNYHYRTCRHCNLRVDRDVNAVLNMLWTAAAARFGRRVRPTPEEVRRRLSGMVMLDPDRLVREGKSLRMDGKVAGNGG